jgi:hypothetical protein
MYWQRSMLCVQELPLLQTLRERRRNLRSLQAMKTLKVLYCVAVIVLLAWIGYTQLMIYRHGIKVNVTNEPDVNVTNTVDVDGTVEIRR